MVAAAIVAAAVVGAAATTYASSQASSATKKASDAAIRGQEGALAQQAALSQPYRDLGESAIPKLQDLLGLGPKGSAGELDALRATPGYQFTKEQGNAGVLNAASSTGLTLSGNTLEALDRFNTGLADSTYQQAVGNLENTVNTGQAAAAGQAANVGNAAANISGIQIGQGNTLAGISANQAAGLSGVFSNAANQYTTYRTLQNIQNQNQTNAGFNDPNAPGYGEA